MAGFWDIAQTKLLGALRTTAAGLSSGEVEERLRLRESALTGESLPVEKSARDLPAGAHHHRPGDSGLDGAAGRAGRDLRDSGRTRPSGRCCDSFHSRSDCWGQSPLSP